MIMLSILAVAVVRVVDDTADWINCNIFECRNVRQGMRSEYVM